MGLADYIGKLITEHGSAEILRTHLALIRDQASALERENATLKARVADAEKKTEALAGEVAAFKRSEQKPKMKWGCLLFDGDDQNLYCPGCFYRDGKRIPTSRKSIDYRFCSVCRTDIPAG
jgi:hypothetical protein